MTADPRSESPEFRSGARAISEAALREVAAPDEVVLSLGFLDPLIELAAEGEVPTIDRHSRSGGFGGADLLALAVAPLAVVALEHLAALAERTADRLTDAELEVAMASLRPRMEGLIRRTGSKRASERSDEIIAAVGRAVRAHQVSLEESEADAGP